MSEDIFLGTINGHVVGRILKETVRRATGVIRSERIAFETFGKMSYDGVMDDLFTSADRKAQETYLKAFKECFPLCGVIGEEDNLKIEASEGCGAYFTVDPLDGTKAYVRKQSHGIATMIALVANGEVISAYIGDINTEEIYGYRPGSNRVHRITRMEGVEELTAGEPIDLSDAYILLRDPPEKYSSATRRLAKRFKNYEAMGSSIGTWMARLWKREVSAVVLTKGWETPWDSTPVIGISQKLGYVFLRTSAKSATGWEEFQPKLPTERYKRSHDSLVIHRRDAGKLGLL